MCPTPAQSEEYNERWCQNRDIGAVEFARSNGDAGEIRTPNYKAPLEIDGVHLFSWGPSQSPWNAAAAFDYDLSTLIRPMKWAFYRDKSRPEIALVLAPLTVTDGVYGILSRESRFVAMRSPPESIGGPRCDKEIASGVPFSSADRAPPDVPERLVPAWGGAASPIEHAPLIGLP